MQGGDRICTSTGRYVVENIMVETMNDGRKFGKVQAYRDT